MNEIYVFEDGSIVPIEKAMLDSAMEKLYDSEFGLSKVIYSDQTNDLINKCGFDWDPLSIPGYLTFKPYAAFMEEAAKDYIWKMSSDFCDKNEIPLHRISGGDIYSIKNDLMKKHVALSEKVGMYGDGLLKISGDLILRFSGCSNKLSLLKNANIEKTKLPFGVFEISDSYRFERDDEVNFLVRNRLFHLPELHIVNEDLDNGLDILLKGHCQMTESMDAHGLDYIMLFFTTKKFVSKCFKFIQELCEGRKHNPIMVISDDDSCENGIVFDVEYKARMSNDAFVEIGTFQIDEGATGFSYGIQYNKKPVATVHAVFFAGSIERTIFTYCDIAANSDNLLPEWLTPVNCRIIPLNHDFDDIAKKYGIELKKVLRVEVDDREESMDYKINDALSLKVPNIILINDSKQLYDRKNKEFIKCDLSHICSSSNSFEYNTSQFSPLLLSNRVLY